MKNIIIKISPVIDLVLSPLVALSAILLRIFRTLGAHNLPFCRLVLTKIGIYPIRDHYYEPLINPGHLSKSLREDRYLPGINFNDKEQLELVSNFIYQEELKQFTYERSDELDYYFNNPSFSSGDSELLYSMIRHQKPSKLIEIGSGYSTLIAASAIGQNKIENNNCEHICIEPYEAPWLEKLENVNVERKLIEQIDQSLFQTLKAGDILFIDSSHMIRPQGDVLVEFLEILPKLPSGVLVHVHDIFTPKDYLDDWLIVQRKFWNEQYLLEAFLSCNNDYRIVCALNYLKHKYPSKIKCVFPVLGQEMDIREPGSFWLVKN